LSRAVTTITTTITKMVVVGLTATITPMTVDTTNLTTLISQKDARPMEEPRKHLLSNKQNFYNFMRILGEQALS
jgi:hypothetical protein